MSCALLIMTLITPIKMNGGIAVSLLHLQKLHVHTFAWLPSRRDVLLLVSSLVCFSHFLWKNTTKQLLPPVNVCDIFSFGSDFLIHFQAQVWWKPMNLWADDTRERGIIWNKDSTYNFISIQPWSLAGIKLWPPSSVICCPSADCPPQSIPSNFQ